MTKLVVLYKKSADPWHFEKHFREVHMPLVQKMPSREAITIIVFCCRTILRCLPLGLLIPQAAVC
jgi:uncharacterized protein (TIGR02118 family)